MTISDDQRRAYAEQGYLILRGAFSPARVRSLADGIRRLVDRALAGQVKLNWIGEPQQGIPERISGLLGPDKYDPVFGEWLEADVIPLVESLLRHPVRHSLVGMLAGGGGKPYVQAWHRDLPHPARKTDPLVIFNPEPFWFTQFNAPLQPGDRFLQIIPRSHVRAATDAEARAWQADPCGDLPGAMTVEMEPGDIACYNANLWHRGYNPRGQLRWTMHSAYWRTDFPVMQHESGQREAFLTAGHLDRLPPHVRATIRAYLDAYPQGSPPGLEQVVEGRVTTAKA